MKIKNTSMSSAPIVYNEDGSVAWNKMWNGFCELAIEGGPPHRGTLLSAQPAHIKNEKYVHVMKEVRRAYGMLIPYPIVDTRPGWIGVRFPVEHIAQWYETIISHENVQCKRKGSIIYLPIHESYTLEKEIKNLVTVVAKAYHYWRDHRTPIEKFFITVFGFDVRWKIMYNKSF